MAHQLMCVAHPDNGHPTPILVPALSHDGAPFGIVGISLVVEDMLRRTESTEARCARAPFLESCELVLAALP